MTTKKKTISPEKVAQVRKVVNWLVDTLLPMVILAAIVAAGLWLVLTVGGLANEAVERARGANADCLAAGYSETRYTTDGYYCIGIRDGNTVTVRVEDLGE